MAGPWLPSGASLGHQEAPQTRAKSTAAGGAPGRPRTPVNWLPLALLTPAPLKGTPGVRKGIQA